MEKEIDPIILKEIATESSKSKQIFQALSKRKRERKETNLYQFQQRLLAEGKKITKEDIFHTFKRLENIGVGTIVSGRGFNATRFIWNYSLKRVARIATQPAIKEKISKFANSSHSEKYSSEEIRSRLSKFVPESLNQEQFIAVVSTSIKLRDEVFAKIEVPLDLTKEDAQKISEIVFSLVQVTPTPKEFALEEKIREDDDEIDEIKVAQPKISEISN